jgi:Polyketide cyclase / dehydrase and lipid transport
MVGRPFRIERTAHVRATPEEVRRLLVDPATWPRWQPEIIDASGPAPMRTGDVARGEATMLGFAVHGHTEALEVTDEVFEEDVIVGVRMLIRYEVTVGEAGTRVTHRLTAQLPGGLSGRVLSFFLRPRLRALQRGVLERIARQAGPSSS